MHALLVLASRVCGPETAMKLAVGGVSLCVAGCSLVQVIDLEADAEEKLAGAAGEVLCSARDTHLAAGHVLFPAV